MSEPITVAVERLAHGQGLPLPALATAQAAGFDLVAAVSEQLELAPGGRAAVPTGLRLAIPSGFEGQVRPRSGLALRHGVTVVNAPGTIDADYRGEVQVALINLGAEPFVVERGMRIAQIVFAPVTPARLVEASVAADDTPRGAGGFGSTGLGHTGEPTLIQGEDRCR